MPAGRCITGGLVTLNDQGQLSATRPSAVNYAELLPRTIPAITRLTNRVNTAATITLAGGTLAYSGRAATISAETLGPVVIAQGLSTITVGGRRHGRELRRFADRQLLAKLPECGGQLHRHQSGSRSAQRDARLGVTGATTPLLVNNIIGGWAIVELHRLRQLHPVQLQQRDERWRRRVRRPGHGRLRQL